MSTPNEDLDHVVNSLIAFGDTFNAEFFSGNQLSPDDAELFRNHVLCPGDPISPFVSFPCAFLKKFHFFCKFLDALTHDIFTDSPLPCCARIELPWEQKYPCLSPISDFPLPSCVQQFLVTKLL